MFSRLLERYEPVNTPLTLSQSQQLTDRVPHKQPQKQVSAIVCSVLVTVATQYGLGRHMASITSTHDQVLAHKYTIINPIPSIIASACGKVSVLIFLLRLMGHAAKRWHLIMLWTACALMVCINVFAIVIIVGFCYPAVAIWDPSVQGSCMSPSILSVYWSFLSLK